MLKIVIAEDEKILRECLKEMIEIDSDISVVGCAENGVEAIDLCLSLLPDMVLMDIMMPECNGIEAALKIKEAANNIKVLFLSNSIDEKTVASALDTGADGFVLKNIGTKELISAIKNVHAGLEVVNKDVLKIMRKMPSKNEKDGKLVIVTEGIRVELSSKEVKIINMIVDGKNNEEIAQELFITPGSLRNIVTAILGKLMLKDRRQLAVFALKNHICDSNT